jgi:iron complex transport system permease protein
VLALGLALVSVRQLNVLTLGERTASSLGMSVERVRFGLSGVAVLAAASVAAAGIVGSAGLVVPHIVRRVVGNDHKRLLVGCAVAGPALMTATDAVPDSRSVPPRSPSASSPASSTARTSST